MAEEENKDSELGLTGPGGWGFRSKGYRVMDLVCLLTAAGVIAMAYYIRGYAGEYENNAKAVRESNEKVSQALKESNAALIKAITDSNDRTVNAISRLTSKQIESNCLQDPMMKNRPDAREFCKRMATRDDR